MYKTIDPKLQKYLEIALENQASDLHLQPNAKPYIRIKSELSVIGKEPLGEDEINRLIFSTMTDNQKVILDQLQELDYSFELENLGRFRVNTYRAQNHYESVLRLVSLTPRTIEQLQLPTTLKDLALKPEGLVLVAGSTGSGKSTTLTAMIHEINLTLSKRIITIENPVEIVHRNRRSLITQREVGTDTRDFATALRSALRQDPDVILIGEIRDKETAEAALQAAQTGHLVLSTIHAGSADELITRFIGLFPPEDREEISKIMATVLRGALVQKLVESTTGQRIPAIELLINNNRVADIISGKSSDESINQILSSSANMSTLDENLIMMAQDMIIKPETALHEARKTQVVMQALRRLGLL